MEWNFWNNRWLSCKWEFRHDRLVLLPGNSSIGYRLPLKSLPYVSPSKVQKPVERSTFEDLPALEEYHEKVESRYGHASVAGAAPLEFTQKAYAIEDASDKDKKKTNGKKKAGEEVTPTFEVYTIKTALCIEMRNGKLYVFMPPLKYVEHY